MFLDLRLQLQQDGQLSFSTFEKECKLPFAPIKFVSPQSNRPHSTCYNVVVGMAFQAAYHSSSVTKAAQHISSVVDKMVSRGCEREELWRRVLNALGSSQLAGLKFEQQELFHRCLHCEASFRPR